MNKGPGSNFWINLENALLPDVPPAGAESPSRPQAFMMSPARKFSCLSMPKA